MPEITMPMLAIAHNGALLIVVIIALIVILAGPGRARYYPNGGTWYYGTGGYDLLWLALFILLVLYLLGYVSPPR